MLCRHWEEDTLLRCVLMVDLFEDAYMAWVRMKKLEQIYDETMLCHMAKSGSPLSLTSQTQQ